jgi:hypothetical protein
LAAVFGNRQHGPINLLRRQRQRQQAQQVGIDITAEFFFTFLTSLWLDCPFQFIYSQNVRHWFISICRVRSDECSSQLLEFAMAEQKRTSQ